MVFEDRELASGNASLEECEILDRIRHVVDQAGTIGIDHDADTQMLPIFVALQTGVRVHRRKHETAPVVANLDQITRLDIGAVGEFHGRWRFRTVRR